jgi:hypothetical protein
MGGKISTQNQIKTRKWLVILEVFQSDKFFYIWVFSVYRRLISKTLLSSGACSSQIWLISLLAHPEKKSCYSFDFPTMLKSLLNARVTILFPFSFRDNSWIEEILQTKIH